MRKHFLLTKTLLVALLCLVGQSAWATEVPYNVGTSTSDAWGAGFSDVWTLTGDGVVTVTFTNHCATDGDWKDNWQLLCGNENYRPGALADEDRYFQMRSNKWEDVANSAAGFIVSDGYLTDFKTFQNEATVNLMIVRSGTTVTVNVAVTKSATTRTMTYVKTGLSGTVNFFLTQSLSYMNITQQNQTTEMAGTISANALVNFEGNTGTGAKGSISVYNSNYNGDNPGVLYLRNGSGTLTIDASEYAGSKDIVTVSFDMMFVSMGKAKTAWFTLQDKDGAAIGGMTFDVYSNVLTNNTLGLVTNDLKGGSWAHFTITLNYTDNSITTITSCPGATNPTSSHKVTMTNTNPLAKFYVGAGYNANADYQKCRFDNLLIQTEKGDYNTTANITLSFKDNEDNDISALYTGTSDFTPDKGSTFTPSDYYPTVMYDENYKYTYTSGGDAFEVTSDAVVTLVYTKSARPTHTFNVTANYGAKNKKIVDEVSVKEAADYTYYYPRFILDGTTLYEYASSTDANASANYWTSTNINVAANANYTLTYNAIEGECVYFSEGEDVTGAVEYTAFKRYMSGGSSAVFNSATKLTTLGEGIYKANIRSLGRTSGDRHTYLYKNSDTEENLIIHKVVSSNSGTDDQALFSLDASTDILAKGGYSTASENGAGIDYVYIMKLPDNVPATLGTNGYATFASPYALDLTTANLPSSVTAYKASVSGTTVTFTALNQTVPANTGVLLNGTGTVNIPVAATGTAVEGNDFLVNNGGATFAGNDSYYYFGLVKDFDPLTFRKFDPSTTAIPADKAYLKVLKSSLGATARGLEFVFDDEVTGVNEVRSQKEDVRSEWFDLQGRKVAQPTKGLYIVNGKKVVLK